MLEVDCALVELLASQTLLYIFPDEQLLYLVLVVLDAELEGGRRRSLLEVEINGFLV